MLSPDRLQFLLTDHLGSVVGVLDDAGNLLSEQRYLPFGESRFAPGITETDFGFTGQCDLAAIGLMDYNARWYHAGIGRFASADPIVPHMFASQSLNRYAYVGNNPLNYIDPSGHALCSIDEGCFKPPAVTKPKLSLSPKPTTTSPSPKPGGYQDINKGIAANLQESSGQPVTEEVAGENKNGTTPESLVTCSFNSSFLCANASDPWGYAYYPTYDGSWLAVFDAALNVVVIGAIVGVAYFGLAPEIVVYLVLTQTSVSLLEAAGGSQWDLLDLFEGQLNPASGELGGSGASSLWGLVFNTEEIIQGLNAEIIGPIPIMPAPEPFNPLVTPVP
jgi:RHS repeat-associated protein